MDNSLKVVVRNNMLQIWAERVKECRNSGMSVKAWCAQQGIKVSTFYAWQKRVFNAVSTEVQQTLPNSRPVFAEIPVELPVQAISTNIAATLRVGDISVDFYENASQGFIEALLRSVKPC